MSGRSDRAYWDERGRAASGSELDAVCYPGAPPFLNRYADWSQRRAIARLLGALPPLRGARVLDVGCGTGRWSRLLSSRGAEVVGIDRSEQMLAEARRRSPRSIIFRQMDAAGIRLDDASFDLAVGVTVIQHLSPETQQLAIAEIVRVVRPGGHVVTVDRTGSANEFGEAHGTYPRPRNEWLAVWRAAGASPVLVLSQEFSYPLRAVRALTASAGGAPAPQTVPLRRGGAGWRRAALVPPVFASYALDLVLSAVAPRAPAEHVAVLYRVGAGPA